MKPRIAYKETLLKKQFIELEIVEQIGYLPTMQLTWVQPLEH